MPFVSVPIMLPSVPAAPLVIPPLMSGWCPPGGGDCTHYTMVALKLQQFQENLKKIFFGPFGAQYFLCFFVNVTARGWGLQGGGEGVCTAPVRIRALGMLWRTQWWCACNHCLEGEARYCKAEDHGIKARQVQLLHQ